MIEDEDDDLDERTKTPRSILSFMATLTRRRLMLEAPPSNAVDGYTPATSMSEEPSRATLLPLPSEIP